MNKTDKKLENMLSKVGDTYFKRCILSIIENLDIQKNDRVLDAGCGEGFYEILLSNLYECSIIGIDNDDKILNAGKERTKNLKNVKLENQDLCNLPYKDNSFDKIICSEVVEHIDQDTKAISELYRVLKPGGRIVITVPNTNYPLFWDPINKLRGLLGLGHFDPKNKYLGGMWSYDHKRLYTTSEIVEKMVATDFEITRKQQLTRYSLPFNILVLNLGKTFYTQLPVGEDVKTAMEKFDWDSENKKKNKSPMVWAINKVKDLILWIDNFNNKDFPEHTATVGISITATKKG
jgi:ubiquinone/menaquinone biosynthesis C-methylase UbiE